MELSRQFERAPGGQVDPDTLKKGYVLLDDLRATSLELAEHYGTPTDDPVRGVMRASHLADAGAIGQAQGMVRELAGELGISLPVNRGATRDR